MRDIKFRAKRLDNEEWIRGNLVHTISDYNKTDEGTKLTDSYYIVSTDGTYFEIDRNTIGQYTELNSIYEGDILRDEEDLYLVEYNYGGFYANGIFSKISYDLWDLSDLQVIGNKYDNLELLDTRNSNLFDKKIYVYIDYHLPEEYREEYFKLTIKEFDEAIKQGLPEIYTTQIEAINSIYYKMGYDIILITSNKVIKMSSLVKNKVVRMTQNWQKMFRANCFDIKGDYSD